MSKSKHTPGPLTVRTDEAGFFWVDKDTKDGGFTVCNTGDGVAAEANANIYAAAPDLLAACKAMKEHFGLIGLGIHFAGDLPAQMRQIEKHAEVAIAKAKGE